MSANKTIRLRQGFGATSQSAFALRASARYARRSIMHALSTAVLSFYDCVTHSHNGTVPINIVTIGTNNTPSQINLNLQ
jgi:hypothetical protein